MSRFLEALHSGRVLLMDGAMGTELQKLGLRDGENAAAWNLLHPRRVQEVHRAYRRVGAQVLLTNTFLQFGLSLYDTLKAGGRSWVDHGELWELAVKHTGSRNNAIFRVASLGPVAGRLTRRDFDDLRYFHPYEWEFEAVDAVLVETCSSPRVQYAFRRIQRCCDKPILLSLTYRHNAGGRLVTFSGHSPEWFAGRAEKWGVAALGVNCGREVDMDDVIEIVRRYRAVTDLPLFARPNAGTPKRKGKRWVYPHTPEAMAGRLPELLEAGVSMVGGCCGTTPEHIAAFRPIVDEWNARKN